MTKATSPIAVPLWRKIATATRRPGKDPTISATIIGKVQGARSVTGRRIRHDEDPLFKRIKRVSKCLPPRVLRPVAEGIGFVTDVIQLPLPLLGLEARPLGSVGVTNVGTYGLDTVFAPMPTFCHLPIVIIVDAVTDKVLARDGKPVVPPGLPVAIELDHRFVDGYQAAAMARLFRAYMADPAAYDPVPTAPPTHKKRRANAEGAVAGHR